jgi:phospholipid-binding lipoprotein MlaA
MRRIHYLWMFSLILNLQACKLTGPNPDDPYEPINRTFFKFNRGLDKVVLRPVAKTYDYIVPTKARVVINNFYTNINMIPTFVNDLLQADWPHASKDAHRFVLNSLLGIGGIFDPATKYGFPLRSNDLGLTFAIWGDKHSPYVVIPFLGPSTIRDGMAMLFDYTFFTPYPYVPATPLYIILAERYVDLRAQMLDTDRLVSESLDKYAFVRDAYLQHRQYLINGETNDETGAMYVEEDNKAESKPIPTSKFPLTTA